MGNDKKPTDVIWLINRLLLTWSKALKMTDEQRAELPPNKLQLDYMEAMNDITDIEKNTAQQCVEILEKMKVRHITNSKEPSPLDERWQKEGQVEIDLKNETLDEAISAIKKQFGIKE